MKMAEKGVPHFSDKMFGKIYAGGVEVALKNRELLDM